MDFIKAMKVAIVGFVAIVGMIFGGWNAVKIEGILALFYIAGKILMFEEK